MILTGTIVNSLTIIVGTVVGMLLGKFIPERMSDAVSKGVALCVLYIGIDGMLAGENTLVAIISTVIVGGILCKAYAASKAKKGSLSKED